ncbi:MAG: universal stress protein [Solirubrobacteraceae bacterium]
MLERILVGVNGRPGGRDALDLATSLRPDGGRLTLANVYPPQAYTWRGGNPANHAGDRNQALAHRAAGRSSRR